jgi:hypothetical protein
MRVTGVRRNRELQYVGNRDEQHRADQQGQNEDSIPTMVPAEHDLRFGVFGSRRVHHVTVSLTQCGPFGT